MAYIYKQKLNIQDLVNLQHSPKKVLIHEPEEYLGSLYSHYLKSNNFLVLHCLKLEALKEAARNFLPDILVFNIGIPQVAKVSYAWMVNFKKDFPNAAIVTVSSGADAEELKKLMSIGVSSHINRKLTRPQDLVIVVKSILHV